MNKKMFIIVIILMLVGCTSSKINDNVEVGVVGNNYPVSRALVAKMLALVNYDKENILRLRNEIQFDDVKSENWYYKYINATYIKGDMSGTTENKFEPNKNLTISQMQYLIDKYDTKKIKIDDNNRDKPISYAVWCSVFSDIMKGKNIGYDELIILGTKQNSKNLQGGFVITDKGLYSYEGFNIDVYKNKKVKVIHKQDEIIAVTEVLDLKPTLKRAIIKKIGNNYIDIFIGGASVNLTYKDIDIKGAYGLCDIQIEENNILDIQYYQNIIKGKINAITNNNIRINNTNYLLEKDFKVYSFINKNLTLKTMNNLIIGEDIATFFTKNNENKIYGAIIDEDIIYDTVRVLTQENKNILNITSSSQDGFNITVKGKQSNLKNLSIKKDDDFNIGENEIIIIKPLKNNDYIIVNDKYYINKLEIYKQKDKYFVIDELSIEDYIYSKLNANTYGYDEIEMLKVLSVIYRTEVINNIIQNNLYKLGVNIQSDINFKNISKDVKEAVNSTKGIYLTYENEVIKPTYFEYSSGITSNNLDIWINSLQKEYLTGVSDYTDEIHKQLNEEMNANIFFKTKDIEALEKDSKYFRWTTTLGKDELANLSKQIICESQKTENINYIIILKNDKQIYKDIKDIGNIKDINVLKRGVSGNIIEIEFIFDNYNILVKSDTLIRKIFKIDFLIDNNNEKVDFIKNVPSSSFVFDKIYGVDEKLEKIVLYGGGYGHNVGLSLYGAYKRAIAGEKYKDIISHYYKNIVFTSY